MTDSEESQKKQIQYELDRVNKNLMSLKKDIRDIKNELLRYIDKKRILMDGLRYFKDFAIIVSIKEYKNILKEKKEINRTLEINQNQLKRKRNHLKNVQNRIKELENKINHIEHEENNKVVSINKKTGCDEK